MWIKNHVKNDVREKMVMQFKYNVILKPISYLLYKLHRKGNLNNHIWGKEILHQPQMGLEGEETRITSTYYLQ